MTLIFDEKGISFNPIEIMLLWQIIRFNQLPKEQKYFDKYMKIDRNLNGSIYTCTQNQVLLTLISLDTQLD